MSMLAEPRRKQRIGPNPRGKFFMEEEDNPGKSLLQKMGWKDGDGLGLQKQGIVEAIRPKIQMSATGLGFDVKSDPWVQHNQDFADVLKKLNENHAETTGSTEKTNMRELESKSKSSRARIHYHKFVKGKDLSRASATDLKSIFGNSTGTYATISKTNVKSEEPIADSEQVPAADESTQVNMGSMTEYFAQKMAGRASRKTKKEVEVEVVDTSSSSEKRRKSRKAEDVIQVAESATNEIKKRRKSKVVNTDLEADEPESTKNSEPTVEVVDVSTPGLPKKRKKTVVEDVLETGDAETTCNTIEEVETLEERFFFNSTETYASISKPNVKKEKSIADSEQVPPAEESIQINMGSMTDYFAQKMVERESRKTKKEVEVEVVDTSSSSEKRRKSRKAEDVIQVAESATNEIKKRRKSKVVNTDLEADEPESTKNSEPTVEVVDVSTPALPKKRKKTVVEDALETGDAETACKTIEEEETLEERLKREMIALKVKKPKDLSHDAMLRICKRFPGANLNQIKGYAFY